MITPAYNLTATERVLPRLALDFTTASLDPRVTVTRALDTATRINSSGYIEGVNANLPRFDYSPTSVGVCSGLLIEEARTNIILNSNNFTGTGWSTINASIASSAVVSPDGTQNTSKLVEDNTNSNHRLQQTVTVTAGAAQVFSAYLYAGERTRGTLLLSDGSNGAFYNFNISTYATISSGTFGTGFTLNAVNYRVMKDGWVRFWISYTSATATSIDTYVQLLSDAGGSPYQGNGTSGFYIYGVQHEVGAFATSYIPTTTTSLTRNADVVDMTGTNFSDWYNATEGTIYAEYAPFTTSGAARGVFSINDGSANNYADWRPNGGNFVVTSGGAGQADMYPGGITVNTVGKGVLALKENSMACALNGNTILTDSTALMPVAPDRLNIGRLNNSAALSICGWMRKIMYWPQRVTDAEVRAFSK